MTFFVPLSKDQPAPVAPVKQADDDVTRFARLAIVIGLLLSLAGTVAAIALTVWGWGTVTVKGVFVFWLSWVAIGWLVAAIFGAWWTFRYKVRRPIDLEDEDRKATRPKAEVQLIPTPVANGEALELYGWRALHYQLIQDHKDNLTREYAEKNLGIPQREYAKLNTIFVALGLKSEKAWFEHEDLLPLLYYGRVTFDPDGGGAWVDRRHLRF